MPTIEGDIDTLSRAIMGEARVETEDLRAEARVKAEEIMRRAQTEAERERMIILERARLEAERIRSQGAATAQLKARALELEQREKLLEQVFNAAGERLVSVLKREDYPAVAVRLLREALAQLRSAKVEINADPATEKVLTKKVLDELQKELHVELTLGKPLEQGTGLIIRAADGRLHVDSTFETRLVRLRSALRSAVYRVLAGENP